MKKKKLTQKTLTPVSAVVAGFALAAGGAQAQSVFDYAFPASYNGTGSTITDQSAAGDNGTFDGALSLTASVPPGATSAGGTESVVTTSGGILTDKDASLANATVAAAGGFTYSVDFMWNGTDSSSSAHTEKIIDYAGTESLQLVTTTGSANLQMVFASDTGVETVAVSTTILPNTWYDVTMSFNTGGNVLVNGDISGVVSMTVNGGTPIVGAATKGTYGDGLDRPIGIGQLGANFGYLVGFNGDIYNPSVSLGASAVPEPSSLTLGALGGFSILGMMSKARRRKS